MKGEAGLEGLWCGKWRLEGKRLKDREEMKGGPEEKGQEGKGRKG